VTLVLAHRGANRQAPENTLAAFRRAVELGAHGVELDVHRTVDDRLVVRHDADSPAGLLPELRLAEVAARLPDVPTLEAVLDVCAGRLVNVEIKNLPHQPGFDPEDRAARLLVELLADRGSADRVLVSSFNLTTVDRVRGLAPGMPTGWLVFGVDPADALARAHEHGHRALHPDVWSLPGTRAPELVDDARRRGLDVNVWTVNEAAEMRRLVDAGVDAIITDVPDLALAVSREPAT
jgi:glycerophosphoryl diester phosphodiesterase